MGSKGAWEQWRLQITDGKSRSMKVDLQFSDHDSRIPRGHHNPRDFL